MTQLTEVVRQLRLIKCKLFQDWLLQFYWQFIFSIATVTVKEQEVCYGEICMLEIFKVVIHATETGKYLSTRLLKGKTGVCDSDVILVN